jgi:hypothetical protein
MTGATCVDRRFRSQVGMGSRSHDFGAGLLSKAVISLTVAGAKRLGPGADLSLIAGGLAAPVDDQIFSTLSLRKVAKSRGVPNPLFLPNSKFSADQIPNPVDGWGTDFLFIGQHWSGHELFI